MRPSLEVTSFHEKVATMNTSSAAAAGADASTDAQAYVCNLFGVVGTRDWCVPASQS